MRKMSLLLLAALAACAGGPVSIRQAMASCARGSSAVEVVASGTVIRTLGTYNSRSGAHEGFLLSTAGLSVRIEDNTTITGPIPLRKGEAVLLQGQYECDDGVVHWTHHDPRLRHVGGFIQTGGKTYR